MDMDAKVMQLQRLFQGTLERDALESVLAVCNGDVKAAEQFLTAGKDDFVDEGPSSSCALPRGYGDRPAGYELTLLKSKQMEAMRELRRGAKGKRAAVVAGGLEPVAEEYAHAVHGLRQFLFEEGTTLMAHLEAYDRDPKAYAAQVAVLLYQHVELPSACKGKVLAVALARRDRPLVNFLLARADDVQLADVLRAVKMLDAPRRYRQLGAKMAALEKAGASAAKVKAVALRRAEVANDVNFAPDLTVSLTGSMAKKLRRWVRQLRKSDLEFFLLQLPDWPWKEFADVVHPAPADFSLDYFQRAVFGAPPPEGSVVARCRKMADMNSDEVEALLADVPVPYSFVRKNTQLLSDKGKALVAKYEEINTVVWWYHELACPAVDATLHERLAAGEEPTFSYGKFMERLMYFKECRSPFYPLLVPIAEKRLREISLPLEPPVMVIGDASFSMDVAIRTSTIIASLLAVLSNAELRFFNDRALTPAIVPRNAAEVLQVAEDTRADGLTAPAAALHDLYKLRQKIKYFVVVTDEIENEAYNGTFFAQLFYNYCVEVYPARIVFVSFLEERNAKGRMVKALEDLGIVPLQFRLDGARPDLTKLDSMLGLLSAESTMFPEIVHHVASSLQPDKSLEVLAQVALAAGCARPGEDAPAAALEESAAVRREREDADAGKGKGKGKGKGAAEEEEAEGPGAEAEAAPDAENGVSLFADEAKPTSGVHNDAGDMMCSICLEKRAEAALVPCGHASFCMKCAESVKDKPCPICRARVTQVLKIFFS